MYTRSLIRIIPAIILVIIISYFFPWWSFSIITLIIGYSNHSEKESVICGFIIGFMSWFIVLVYLFTSAGDDQIFSKMSMLIINKNNPMQLITYSSLISGTIGSLSSWIGWQFNRR